MEFKNFRESDTYKLTLSSFRDQKLRDIYRNEIVPIIEKILTHTIFVVDYNSNYDVSFQLTTINPSDIQFKESRKDISKFFLNFARKDINKFLSHEATRMQHENNVCGQILINKCKVMLDSALKSGQTKSEEMLTNEEAYKFGADFAKNDRENMHILFEQGGKTKQ